jgi:hypothetical protein
VDGDFSLLPTEGPNAEPKEVCTYKLKQRLKGMH